MRAWDGVRRRQRRRKPWRLAQISFNAPSYTNGESGVGAVDVNLSDKDSLRGRFVLNRYGSIDTASQFPIFFQTIPSNYYLATFTEFHTFSPGDQRIPAGFQPLLPELPGGRLEVAGAGSIPLRSRFYE